MNLSSEQENPPFECLVFADAPIFLTPIAQSNLIFSSRVFMVCILTNVYWLSQRKEIHGERLISNLLPSYTIMKYKDNCKECGCVSSMLKACVFPLIKSHF